MESFSAEDLQGVFSPIAAVHLLHSAKVLDPYICVILEKKLFMHLHNNMNYKERKKEYVHV